MYFLYEEQIFDLNIIEKIVETLFINPENFDFYRLSIKIYVLLFFRIDFIFRIEYILKRKLETLMGALKRKNCPKAVKNYAEFLCLDVCTWLNF